MNAVWGNFKSWAKQPFSADMDLQHWFLFIGLILVLMILWGIIMRHVTEGL